MKEQKTLELINAITSDEDERQELWLCCLRDGATSDIAIVSAYLANIRKTYTEDHLLQITLWKQVYTADQHRVLALFEEFSEFEQTVLRLLAIGATLDQISSITTICKARLRHVISVIRGNEAWKTFNGT